ncbi:hypothetical protein QUC31_013295, partial [Theobroma cacao]
MDLVMVSSCKSGQVNTSRLLDVHSLSILREVRPDLENQNMMGNLPLDLIADILSRLPVKYVLRLRCVSKAWRSLIGDPDFIKLHLRHSLESRTNHTLILKSSDLYAADLACLGPFAKLEHPLMSYNHGVKILGSCNGLLCIRNIVEDMAIWNPYTRKHQVLPSLSSCNAYVYGFGYDTVSDDYKVVKIMQLGGVDGKALESEVKICSLKRLAWRRIPDIPCIFSFPGVNGVFASGALHWVLTHKVQLSEENVIVALDLAAEKYREIPQPEYIDKRFQLDVGVLGGCLCAIANYDDVRVDLWVMKEYGLKESWTRLFSVAREEVIGPLRYVKPLAYSRSGDQVLLEHNSMNHFWYDLKERKANDVWFDDMRFSCETEICLQSLVSLYVNRRQLNREDNGDIQKILMNMFWIRLGMISCQRGSNWCYSQVKKRRMAAGVEKIYLADPHPLACLFRRFDIRDVFYVANPSLATSNGASEAQQGEGSNPEAAKPMVLSFRLQIATLIHSRRILV